MLEQSTAGSAQSSPTLTRDRLSDSPPSWFVQAVKTYAAGLPGRYAAQLLWQRGICDLQQLAGFLNPALYQPTSPFEFGCEMEWAVERLRQARERAESVAIWGDFDADGITSTAVLWEGLGQFFVPDQHLRYYIPNRLKESHGLSIRGLEALAAQGCRLVVTCDTGSTNLAEIAYANQLGMDVIVTDHHTLPPERPPVVAIINPRSLPADHPLAHLSGVAVAYKLVEALYETLPEVPQQPLHQLLDLVAIGLIADLVQLTGDCRYLAQKGIEQLQQQMQLGSQATRPGITKLLELCKKSGDRPTDISFGLGPRINAVSRIQGDAHFCVELLTSRDEERCRQLAEETELANIRRKSLQREVTQQVKERLAQLDLSTTSVIVLSDPQWPTGVLGLVASQIAHGYGRPTILLSAETADLEPTEPDKSDATQPLARGSARSINQIDLYQLVQEQAHLLHSFGGHPFAAGLSLPIANLPLFTEAINRQLRQQDFVSVGVSATIAEADLEVTVAELGKDLFRELKLLEPCGMGNPVPKLLIRNCWFERAWHRNIQDLQGRKVQYIKTNFELWDDSTTQGFPGVWWGHYKDEIPSGRCDVVVELDFNSYENRPRRIVPHYEVRLLAILSASHAVQLPRSLTTLDWLWDWRTEQPDSPPAVEPLLVSQCPASWAELQAWLRRSLQESRPLAIAYPPPNLTPPAQLWQQLVGVAKYLDRTQNLATRQQLQAKLGIGDRSLQLGFQSLRALGFDVKSSEQGFQMHYLGDPEISNPSLLNVKIQPFLEAVQEEQFRRQYFYQVPFSAVQTVAEQLQRSHLSFSEPAPDTHI